MATELEALRRKIASLEETVVSTALIRPNEWNFNVQSDRLFRSLKAALDRFGRIYPIIVREVEGGKYEIIDGEHRWKALCELGIKVTPVKNLGTVSDIEAKELMTILNQTRGEANPEKLGLSLARIVRTMEEEGSNPLDLLPYDEEQLKRLIDVGEDFHPAPMSEEGSSTPEPWVQMKEATRLCDHHVFTRIKMRRCTKCGTLES